MTKLAKLSMLSNLLRGLKRLKFVKMSKVNVLIFASGVTLAGYCVAGNPVFVPNIGATDPHIKIFNGKAYMYASHDHAFENKRFDMREWWIFSSTDLVEWKHESTLKPSDTFIGESDVCWATDAIEKNGKYYWYLSAGKSEVAVVVGDTPTGPWRDVLKKPMISKDVVDVRERDPAVFTDAKGDSYILFGVWDFYIAKLNDDMISLAETPRKITIKDQEGPYGKGKTDDKVDIHWYAGNYYLSWGAYYAMAKNIYGPYQSKGAFIKKEYVDPAFRNQDLDHDRHGKFFDWGGQWYFATNDKSQKDSHGRFRNVVISYVDYEENGEIKPLVIDKKGVRYPPAR